MQQEYRKKKWKLTNPDDTFMSTSTYDEIGQLRTGGDDEKLASPNEKATQTEVI